jgi:UDP-N-acetylmuramate dehydrogenase
VLVTAGSGWRTALLVRKTVDDGLTGLEYFLGVPGWLGGALYNNAHYTTELIADHVMKVQVITREGELKWLDRNACAFGYDDSRFHTSGEVIIAAQFSLQKGEKAKSLQLIQDSTRSRALSQPLGTPSSGCYFRNVPNTPLLQQRFPQFAHKPLLSAGFLIDQAGLKKQRVGDIMVSEKHAAFLVNVGQGTSAQVAALAQHIKDEIRKQFSVELIPEVFWIGKR